MAEASGPSSQRSATERAFDAYQRKDWTAMHQVAAGVLGTVPLWLSEYIAGTALQGERRLVDARERLRRADFAYGESHEGRRHPNITLRLEEVERSLPKARPHRPKSQAPSRSERTRRRDRDEDSPPDRPPGMYLPPRIPDELRDQLAIHSWLRDG
jgi:hypothetical protein